MQGFEGPPKTLSSYRDTDMLDPLYEVLKQHREFPVTMRIFRGLYPVG